MIDLDLLRRGAMSAQEAGEVADHIALLTRKLGNAREAMGVVMSRTHDDWAAISLERAIAAIDADAPEPVAKPECACPCHTSQTMAGRMVRHCVRCAPIRTMDDARAYAASQPIEPPAPKPSDPDAYAGESDCPIVSNGGK